MSAEGPDTPNREVLTRSVGCHLRPDQLVIVFTIFVSQSREEEIVIDLLPLRSLAALDFGPHSAGTRFKDTRTQLMIH